ncbi:hypothetical protein Pint_27333 [Pistacia integerrima]|uniref:Uncharacterized protein n=1 Tax=Pistacia integerrima TaxID=434235 RepID=A0ACC0YN42_9ROSI|nr:hypothetical protein Pint_27333 [Pistacia integerrima]
MAPNQEYTKWRSNKSNVEKINQTECKLRGEVICMAAWRARVINQMNNKPNGERKRQMGVNASTM